MAVNKVIYGDQTLMDLTGDTVTADKLLSGATAHNASGEQITGSMLDKSGTLGTINTASDSFTIPQGYHDGQGTVSISQNEQAKIISENIKSGVEILGVTGTHEGGGTDTSDATANALDILAGQTAYVDGEKVTGTMINRGQVTGSISYVNDVFAISQGYHDGTGSVTIDSAEQAKIIPENIKSGVRILGVEGSYEGDGGVDTSGDTVTANRMLAGTTAHDANGNAITGTMTNRGSFSATITRKDQVVTIPQGYHDGTGTVQISSSEQDKIIPENISGYVSILGVDGSLSGVDTSNDTVESWNLLENYTAHDSSGEEITGTMPDQGSWSLSINNLSDIGDSLYIPRGYHSGGGEIYFDGDAQIGNLIPGNIKAGVEILGVTGSACTFIYSILSENRYDVRDFTISAQSSQIDYSALVTYNANNDSDYFDEYVAERGCIYFILFPYSPENAKAVFSYDSTANRTENITNCYRIMADGQSACMFIAPANGFLLVSRGDNYRGRGDSGQKSYYKIEVDSMRLNWGLY